MEITLMPEEFVSKSSMQDKQIYAYSWRRDLVKKIKKYFEQRQQKRSSEVVVKLEEPTIQTSYYDNQKSVTVKPLDKKAEKEKPKKKKSETTEDYFDSPLLRKERQEKILTYFIASAMIFIFLTGVLLANGVIDFQMLKGSKSKNISPSPIETVTTTPTIELITITPSFTQAPSPTRTNKPIIVTPPQTSCKISGCNGEICADESLGEISSICLYQAKFSCYKSGICERQPDGRCGWTQSSELLACLDQYQ